MPIANITIPAPPNTPIGLSPFSAQPIAAGLVQPTTQTQLNQMLNAIAAASATFSGVVPVMRFARQLTQAEIQNWQTSGGYSIPLTPFTVALGAQFYWSVLRWWFDKKISTVYSVNLTLTLSYANGNSCGQNTITSGLNSTTRTQVGAAQSAGAGNDNRNQGLIVTANGNPTGGNAADSPIIYVDATPIFMQT